MAEANAVKAAEAALKAAQNARAGAQAARAAGPDGGMAVPTNANLEKFNSNISAAEAALAKAREAVPEAPAPTKPSKTGEFLQLFGVISVESALGFVTGLAMGRNNTGAVAGAIIALSFVFALEFYLRYGGNANGAVFFGGLLVLIMAGVIPYVAMSKGGKRKNKEQSRVMPATVASWAGVAAIYGLVCARLGGVNLADALQGIILSLLYAAVTVSIGFNTGSGQGKSPTTAMAVGTWGALALFDIAGVLRDKPALKNLTA